MYQLRLHRQVNKDFRRIGKQNSLRIRRHIETHLLHSPFVAGKALSGDLQGLWSFRVGSFRIIYETLWDGVVYILLISHRKDVYNEIKRRLGV